MHAFDVVLEQESYLIKMLLASNYVCNGLIRDWRNSSDWCIYKLVQSTSTLDALNGLLSEKFTTFYRRLAWISPDSNGAHHFLHKHRVMVRPNILLSYSSLLHEEQTLKKTTTHTTTRPPMFLFMKYPAVQQRSLLDSMEPHIAGGDGHQRNQLQNQTRGFWLQDLLL